MQPSGMNTHHRKCYKIKILWNFSVQTTQKLEHNKPNILIIDKHTRECHRIDVACPFDTRVKEKEQGRTIRQIEDRDRETLAMQKVVVTSIIIGALVIIGN